MSCVVALLVYAWIAFLSLLARGVAAMTPEEHAQHAVIQYPALQEVMQPLEANVRASVLQAIILTIREAQHEERRVCAKIALDEAQEETSSACRPAIERS